MIKGIVKQSILAMILLWIPLAGLADQSIKNPLLKSWEQYLQYKRNSLFNLQWISIGPVMNSARVEAVQCDPKNPFTIYTAFGSGNLWKTTNNGLTWKPLFENQSALGIGDIALAPSDPNIIWLGSGESLKKARNFTMPGTGVFRSIDGGETWQNMGLHDSYHIGEIAIHPTNPQIVFVAVLGHFWTTNPSRGLYRTEDGGKTWERVLYINEKVGANDVVISPANPDIIYASLWENHPGICGPNSGIYRSENNGKSWKRIMTGLPSGPKKGRIGLAVSHQDAHKVYALIDNLNRKKQLSAEVYKTTDGGEYWRRAHTGDLLIFPGIGWYFCDCYVNPKNDEEVYALGVRLARSVDGGKNFSYVEGNIFHLFPSPAQTLHLDHCELWINPDNPNHLILGNDGGLYVSTDRGRNWLHHNNIPAGEFYDIAVDNQNPYQVYGGVQDNSTVYGPAREWDPRWPDDWKYVWLDAWSGGDGCFTVPDPQDANIVYFSLQNGVIRRKNMSKDRSRYIKPKLQPGQEGPLKYVFVAPYIISPHDRFTLYHGGNYLYKSTNQGDSWQRISPDLSRSRNPVKSSTAVSALAESRLKQGELFAGTDKGLFWFSPDDGKSWHERSQGLPNRYIRSIEPSRFKSSRVYIAVTGINSDDLNNYLFVSNDRGRRWASISADLPNEVAYTILEDPTNENILYAGLYRGVYISTDRGKHWNLLGPQLPAMAIADLVIQEREMDLIAGTHGRGIYKMNVKPIQMAYQSGSPAAGRLFPIATATLPWINDTHRDPLIKTMNKVAITFYLTDAARVTIRVIKNQKSLWQREITARRGFNQIRWNLVLKEERNPHPYFIHTRRFIPAGNYSVQISGTNIDLSQPMTVIKRTTPPWQNN